QTVFKPTPTDKPRRKVTVVEEKEVETQQYSEGEEDTKEEEHITTEKIQEKLIESYKKSVNKPDLILEPGEDPTKYEEIPAYERRNMKIEGVRYTRQKQD
ncbi:MAG: hypothetical protein Q4B21_07625, partial [Bacteroidia bacterium]|nr:hypothetical protein [Bacteroidia bacterium]